MKTSDRGIELIKKHEALRLEAYKCPAGIWTIGYGHTRSVVKDLVITEDLALQLLKQDLANAEYAVNRERLNLNQNQFDALVSFVFNLGSGNFQKSTLLRKIKNNPNDVSIKEEFARWVYANGVVLPGLVKRRKEESNLYFEEL